MKKYTLLGFLLLLLVVGCRKSLDETSTIDTKHTPVLIDNYTPATENIVSAVIGTVVDEAGNLVEGAQISLDNLNATSNQFGTFEFDNIQMNKLGTFVQVKKDGYYLTGRRFYPIENETSVVKIELIEQNFDQNFESNNGGSIIIKGQYDPLGNPDNGGTIVFQPNSIQDAGGNIYNGTVQIATTWLSPTSLNTFDRMPGALEGVSASTNQEIGLVSYGMMGVELQGSNGEPLNIAEGQTAEINMKVPSSLQNSAPAEIPLWSFNYTYGIWVEEGKALLQNGSYVGEVSHFSFWNCDVPRAYVNFDAIIVEENNGDPLNNVMVKISSNGAGSGTAYSNENGIVSGPIPGDEILLLEVFSSCGEVIHSENIGPYTSDISLGEIEVTADVVTHVTGEILDCDGNLASNGIVILKYDNKYVTHVVENNPFSITTTLCNNTSQMEVIGGDFGSQQQSDPVIVPISNNINVGSLAGCGQSLMGTLKVTVEGTTRYFLLNNTQQLPDTITPYLTYLSFFNQPNVPAGDSIMGQIHFNHVTGVFPFPAGDYSAHNGVDVIIDTQNDWQFTANGITGEGFTTFIVEEYGTTTGTVISGYMSGILINTLYGLNVPTFVEAEFSAIRSQ